MIDVEWSAKDDHVVVSNDRKDKGKDVMDTADDDSDDDKKDDPYYDDDDDYGNNHHTELYKGYEPLPFLLNIFCFNSVIVRLKMKGIFFLRLNFTVGEIEDSERNLCLVEGGGILRRQ